MNLVAARNAAQLAKTRTDGILEVVTTARIVRCILQCALAAKRRLKFLFNRVEIDLFTAVIVSVKYQTATKT
mgnify:FL=1